MSGDELGEAQQLEFTDEPAALKDCNVFIVTVPIPIDEDKRPDVRPLESPSRTVVPHREFIDLGVRALAPSANPMRSCST